MTTTDAIYTGNVVVGKGKLQMTRSFTFAAIETRYHGYRFRSRLEARHAVFFDTLGIEYSYEHEGYDLEGTWYLPDFYLPRQDCFVEIKGQAPDQEEREKARLLAFYTQKRVCTFYGTVEVPDQSRRTSLLDRPAQLRTYHSSEYDVGGPSTTRVHVSSYILALLQKLEYSSISLFVDNDGALVLKPHRVPYAVDSIDDLLAQLGRQQQTLISIRALLEEKEEELRRALSPADGWRIAFFPQAFEGLEDECFWYECDTCGQFDISSPFAHTHRCNETTLGKLLHDTPRLIAAYTAARSARFE